MIKNQINHKIQYKNHKLLTIDKRWFGILEFINLEFICILFFDIYHFQYLD